MEEKLFAHIGKLYVDLHHWHSEATRLQAVQSYAHPKPSTFNTFGQRFDQSRF